MLSFFIHKINISINNSVMQKERFLSNSTDDPVSRDTEYVQL